MMKSWSLLRSVGDVVFDSETLFIKPVLDVGVVFAQGVALGEIGGQDLDQVRVAFVADAEQVEGLALLPVRALEQGREARHADVLARLLEAHEHIITESREFAKKASDAGDEGTNDLLISDVVRGNELQAWFVAEHLVDTPSVRAD